MHVRALLATRLFFVLLARENALDVATVQNITNQHTHTYIHTCTNTHTRPTCTHVRAGRVCRRGSQEALPHPLLRQDCRRSPGASPSSAHRSTRQPSILGHRARIIPRVSILAVWVPYILRNDATPPLLGGYLFTGDSGFCTDKTQPLSRSCYFFLDFD